MTTNSSTADGTFCFAKGAVESKSIDPKHFREFSSLHFSSLGIGTYLGGLDSGTDQLVESAVFESIKSGAVNVVDTAINYRYQKAERSVGRALRLLISNGLLERDQFFISTKNGYLAPDADHPHGIDRYIQDELIDKGIITPDEIVDSSHCMTQKYLSHELKRSLANLQLNCVDLMYIHNAAESQIPVVGKKEFVRRLHEAFSFFEAARKEGKILYYGMATWDCFRVPETEESHLELEDVVQLAREVGGPQNGFRFVQFPFNLAMPEALVSKTQKVNGEELSLLQSCVHLGVGAFTSVPLLQGRILPHTNVQLKRLSKSQVNLQFARSSPGIIAPLVGQKQPIHVSENIALARFPPLDADQFRSSFLN